jgi:type II secretory pathway pseudopilin PulG
MPKKKVQKGFTLVETLLFLGLSSVTALTLLFFLVNINRINTSLRTTRDIEQYGALAQEEINRRVTNAEYIISPEVVDGESNRVVLKERNTDNFSEIRVEGEQLLISQNGGSLNPLLPDSIVISAASFERLNTTGRNQGIRYEFTLGYDQSGSNIISEDFTYTQTFSSTINTQDTANVFPKSDLIAWYDPAQKVILQDDGQSITYWTDVSGNGNNLYTVDSNGAIIADDILNGNPVARFDGSGDTVRGSLVLNSSTFTVIMVVNPTVITSGPGETFFELYGADRVLLQVDETTDGVLLYKEGDVLSVYESASVGEFATYTVTHSADSLTLHKNGAYLGGETLSSGLPSFENIVFGDDSTNGDDLIGDIAEVLIFDKDLSGNERKQVEDYLNAKFNIYSTFE